MSPLAIDLYCGLGGWTEGLLAAGYRVVGFDIERHRYPQTVARPDIAVKRPGMNWSDRSKRGARDAMFNLPPEIMPDAGWVEYPAQLVIQDVLTLHGSQFKDAALIVASPPCQEYSYMAMPWSRAKKIAEEYRAGIRDVKKLTALFDACFRIQREASEAAGRHIPMVVENVRGAQEWVGRAAWHYGSFYLWGDVPALMPITWRSAALKNPNHSWDSGGSKNRGGGSWFGPYAERQSRWSGNQSLTSSKSKARKAASASIAKIPFPLAEHIARTWKPTNESLQIELNK